MANENLVIWTTDWHCVSNDSELSTTGVPTGPTKATRIVEHLNGLDPYGCFDTGDNKDHYGGVGTADEHDNYITYVQNELTWLPVNAAADVNATFPNLPGNHDEFYDQDDTPPGGNNDFAATYDTKFWGSPYHWTCDWPAARIRFIGIHSYMHHLGTAYGTGLTAVDASGIAHVDVSEHAWLTDKLNTLPDRYQAIICTHFPIQNAVGNNIKYTGDDYDFATTPLNDILIEHQSKVVVGLSGHRHLNWDLRVQDGITHITSGGASYGAGNGLGCFVTITYSPSNRSLTFDCRYAASPWARLAAFTPLVIQLQPHRLYFART